jgi:hypothetical protein
MTTVVPNIIGPINSGNSFTVVSIINDAPCVLLLSSTKTYYWESDLSKVTNVPAFYATGEAPNLIIRDTINTGGMSLANSLLVNVLNPQPISVTQDDFAQWFPPTVLLSKVPYSMSYQGATGSIAVGTEGATIPATGIYFVNSTNYFNCGGGKTPNVSGPLNNTINWVCLANPNLNVDKCSQYILTDNNAWTNSPDCQIGVQYDYCPLDSLCGTASCNGPCGKIYDDCTYNNGSYTCIFDVEKYLADVPWYQNYIIIFFVVGITIIVVLLGLLLVRWHNNSLALARQKAQQAQRRKRYEY